VTRDQWWLVYDGVVESCRTLEERLEAVDAIYRDGRLSESEFVDMLDELREDEDAV
jgi:hypothetical protein